MGGKTGGRKEIWGLVDWQILLFCKLDGGKKTKYKNCIKSYGCGVSIAEFEQVNDSLFQPIYSIYFHAKNFL